MRHYRSMCTRLIALALVLWPASVAAQITPTFTFVAGTVINQDEVNANFALFANALNRTGGVMTGTLTSQLIVPDGDNTRNLGSAAASFASGWFDGTLTAANVVINNTGLQVKDTDGSHNLLWVPGSNLTANRTLTVVTGDANRTLTLNADVTLSGTQTGTNTGDQSLFQTIQIAGQADVVAETTADILTLVAGAGVTLTTNAGTDTVTISATAAGGDVSAAANFANDNRLIRSDGTLKGVQASGVTVDDSANVSGVGTLSILPGAAALTARVGGVIYRTEVAVANVGAGEDDLLSQSIAASTLSADGQSLTVRASGSFAPNGNGKRIRVYFGATAILDTGPIAAAGEKWVLNCAVVRTGAGTQKADCDIAITNPTSAFLVVGTATPGETLSGAVTFKITGEAVSNGDITAEFWKIWWWPQ